MSESPMATRYCSLGTWCICPPPWPHLSELMTHCPSGLESTSNSVVIYILFLYTIQILPLRSSSGYWIFIHTSTFLIITLDLKPVSLQNSRPTHKYYLTQISSGDLIFLLFLRSLWVINYIQLLCYPYSVYIYGHSWVYVIFIFGTIDHLWYFLWSFLLLT